MADLFDSIKREEPLAARMRPRNLDEYAGQDHIVGKGRLLRRAIQADRLSSVIFYGPPGCGKTTLARVIAAHTKSDFITLNAVLSGIQQIRDAIKSADENRKLYGRRTILFVDEVHRWNKSQQDALLPWVENGTVILVGATTENPFFEVNRALVSRSRVFQLKPLRDADLRKAAESAILDKERGYGRWQVEFEQGALEHLVETASGDARCLLNALELAVETSVEKWPPEDGEKIFVSKAAAEESIQKKVVLYDKDGDYHYDTISAFIKSLRGRDPDAALYWLARMVAAGEDPHFIFRRMLISACEDSGLASPYAVCVVESCAAAFDRIGLPEGRYHLAHAALFLATCPKSNSSMGFFDALDSVQKEMAEVPNHLKDASRDGAQFGHGEGYLYPHAYRDHWVEQQYLPDSLAGRVFYTPSGQGYEKTIAGEVFSRRELQLAAMFARDSGEFLPFFAENDCEKHEKSEKKEESLTFSPKNVSFENWQRRTDENAGEILRKIRDEILDAAKIVRHSRSIVFNADNGSFLWELLRRAPEGFSAAVCKNPQSAPALEHYAKILTELERPAICTGDFSSALNDEFCAQFFGDADFDKVFFQNTVQTKKDLQNLAENFAKIRNSRRFSAAKFYFFAKISDGSARISETFAPFFADKSLLREFSLANEEFYQSEEFLGLKSEKDAEDFFGQGAKSFSRSFDFEFRLSKTWLESLFSAEQSPFGRYVAQKIGAEKFAQVFSAIRDALGSQDVFKMRSAYAFFEC